MTTTSPLENKSNDSLNGSWVSVCSEQDLVANSGVCVLIGKQQIALFCMVNYAQEISLYACDNYDPIGKANVLSRGILCSIGDTPCISSPLYKQHFSLVDGLCLEQLEVSVNVYQVKLEQGLVSIYAPASLTS
ncbi:nitrite reductase small subunit NirD [Glaciecola sp. 2405UD65-10]|uniref:nitrite reductase small subunit NirD n=1 Tax=Glaciecola sp. 2405UD65-10 TaxID=3397244 RepID=UPI003B5AE994